MGRLGPMRLMGRLGIIRKIFLSFVGGMGCAFQLSCEGGYGGDYALAEEDSLCIDTVATLDPIFADTVAQADTSLVEAVATSTEKRPGSQELPTQAVTEEKGAGLQEEPMQATDEEKGADSLIVQEE